MADEENSSLSNRVTDIEVGLLRQEHRLIPLVHNVWCRKENYPNPNDPRRNAVVLALMTNLLFSPQALAAGGGLAALLTVGLLAWQNYLLQESLFPQPTMTAVMRPMVKAVANASPSPNALPDIGIDGRVFEMAFAANDGGPFLMDVVNLRVVYSDFANNLIQTQYFESKSRSKLPLVGKSAIELTELQFTKFGSETTNPVKVSAINYPIRVTCEFAISALDVNGHLWHGTIAATIAVIDDGTQTVTESDLVFTAPNDALRTHLQAVEPSQIRN